MILSSFTSCGSLMYFIYTLRFNALDQKLKKDKPFSKKEQMLIAIAPETDKQNICKTVELKLIRFHFDHLFTLTISNNESCIYF